MSKGITVLGATGTIGINTLDVLSRHSDRFHVVALTANRNYEKLLDQCRQFSPRYAVVVDEFAAEQLQKNVQKEKSWGSSFTGKSALEYVASLDDVDYVMAAIVGAAGLMPSLAAAKAGKRVMLANKEALVMSGKIFMDAIYENNAELLPIDSEHNAIFQCMPTASQEVSDTGLLQVLLTGSGGPFRTRAISTLAQVTPEEAVAHPNWVMGKKISVDSATMMNKGLEVIEACWLFDVDTDKIQVVIHPESTIHSMVSYNDGSVLAQLGNPDMRTPIAYALGWPDRIDAGVSALNMFDVAQLNFEKPNYERFPCLRLASEAHQTGGYASIALNAANEVAVEAFLQREILFTDIPLLIESVLQDAPTGTPLVIEDVLVQDAVSREKSESWVHNKKKK